MAKNCQSFFEKMIRTKGNQNQYYLFSLAWEYSKFEKKLYQYSKYYEVACPYNTLRLKEFQLVFVHWRHLDFSVIFSKKMTLLVNFNSTLKISSIKCGKLKLK